ncbi:hypothetical protein BLNAU_20363 [Blattamonas nauphoetae]|uniref:Amine oxidase domain-containing protein n=1 Tax=Blattamonas nauphoetae TaxID=2049346 RepID=A0ABQ9X1C9_9EUKA|nr:hypothetical protein BLNAU_20363 [Blattamonas nauphoetae]
MQFLASSKRVGRSECDFRKNGETYRRESDSAVSSKIFLVVTSLKIFWGKMQTDCSTFLRHALDVRIQSKYQHSRDSEQADVVIVTLPADTVLPVPLTFPHPHTAHSPVATKSLPSYTHHLVFVLAESDTEGKKHTLYFTRCVGEQGWQRESCLTVLSLVMGRFVADCFSEMSVGL